MLARILAASTMAAATLVPALAQETILQRWLKEDVFWIISDQERGQFNRLQTDGQRALFIDDFWIRRDPTPGTPDNEFRTEHYRRVQWANDHFSSADWPGWKTDRGMMYIRFGAPDEKDSGPTESPATSTYPYERWHYRYMEGVGRDVMMEFVDKTRSNEYELTWDPGEKNALLRPPGAALTLYERMGLANKR
jgi:GWxTD domain-containing protein